tara:strand:- start:253 stop:576 length:324 start_codon:yes stop_codon:yes gene_type:complete
MKFVLQLLFIVAALIATTSAINIYKTGQQQQLQQIMEYVPGQEKYIPQQHHEMTTFGMMDVFKMLPFEDGTNEALIIVLIVVLVIIGVVLCCCCCACCAFAGAAAKQ